MYWKFEDNGEMKGGWVRSLRLMWGMKIGGSVFHRAVTTLTVKWIIRRLIEDWIPHIKCKKTKAWMEERTSDPHPFMVNGFLDDFFIFIAGTDEDIALAHAVVMKAFEYLGWEISKSKFEEEGTPSTDGVILGHGINTEEGVRYITPTKVDRIRREANL